MDIPTPSVTTQYITDPTSGFIYTVTTTVEVLQQTPDAFQLLIDQANRNAQAAQDIVAALQPQLDSFTQEVSKEVAQPAQAQESIQS